MMTKSLLAITVFTHKS